MPRLALAAGIVLALAAPLEAAAQDAVERGRALARAHCSRCHVIGDFNRMGGIGSTPSFQLLRRLDDWQERFSSFYERRPHPALVRVEGVPPWTKEAPTSKPILLSRDDVDALLAYARAIEP